MINQETLAQQTARNAGKLVQKTENATTDGVASAKQAPAVASDKLAQGQAIASNKLARGQQMASDTLASAQTTASNTLAQGQAAAIGAKDAAVSYAQDTQTSLAAKYQEGKQQEKLSHELSNAEKMAQDALNSMKSDTGFV